MRGKPFLIDRHESPRSAGVWTRIAPDTQEANATGLLLRAVREDAKDRTVEALRRNSRQVHPSREGVRNRYRARTKRKLSRNSSRGIGLGVQNNNEVRKWA